MTHLDQTDAASIPNNSSATITDAPEPDASQNSAEIRDHGHGVGAVRDVHLLFELGALRHVDRTWRHFGGFPFANVAEHSFRVAWLAWVIATREGGDTGKVVLMAMVHDTPETRTGDVNYLSRMYTTRHEQLAFDDQYAATSVGPQAASLWAEYEARETLEARIVKDADTLDCDFELREAAAAGSVMEERLAATRLAAFNKLNTEAAREIYRALAGSDPHSWHVNGRNRHTHGDWSG
jgi:putative hydrolase of HD superfamily